MAQLLVVSLCPMLLKPIRAEFSVILLATCQLFMTSLLSAMVLRTANHSGLSETLGALTGVSKVSSDFAEV